MFVVAILLLNAFILCNKIIYILKNSDYIKDDEELHIGEYSTLNFDGLELENKATQFLELQKKEEDEKKEETVDANNMKTPFLDDNEKDSNPFGKSADTDAIAVPDQVPGRLTADATLSSPKKEE